MHPICFNRVNQTLDCYPLPIQGACNKIGQGYPEGAGQRLSSSCDADFWLNDDWRNTTGIGDTGICHNGAGVQRQDWAVWQLNENATRRICDEESGVSFLVEIVEGDNSAKMDRIGPRRLLIRKGMGLPRGR